MEKITIPVSYLDEVCTYFGKTLTGKCMKRFEILEDKTAIKAEIKELIYEETRRLKETFIAFNLGRELTQFEFKTKPTIS
jgi:hypothetical protein